MKPLLEGKTILLGVSGSIAVYKTVDWARALRRDGAVVRTIMTDTATRFVAPLTFAALTGNPVGTDMFLAADTHLIPHISLARQADCILLAPATATTLARLAHGLADNLLSAVVMAATAPVIICPAMNTNMLQHPATQANLATLRRFGYRIIEPESGRMACGEEGAGRLPDWDQVRETVLAALRPQDLAGKTVLVSAGPTREHLDPARFLGNRSTGKMGYALARIAERRGAEVTLISGPSSLPVPRGVKFIPISSAVEMRDAVMENLEASTVIIKAAAVADYRPVVCSNAKIKKQDGPLAISLTRNPDIISEIGKKKGERILVGFAMESENLIENAKAKMLEKNMDLIIANDLTEEGAGFQTDTNIVKILSRNEEIEELPLMNKAEVANRILDRVKEIITRKGFKGSRG